MRREPEEIVQLCTDHGMATHGLRSRMDADWGLYMLEAFTGAIKGQDEESAAAEVGYHHHTSSEPRSLYNKIFALMTGAKHILTISTSGDPRNRREVDNLKEEWIWGVLRQGDDRLRRMMQPKLLNQLAYYIALRGWFFGRSMLKKRLNGGGAVVDITPWDPRHVYWSLGEDGLLWCVYKTGRKASQIESEYGLRPGAGLRAPGAARDAEELLEVYDYYDGEHNIVVAAGEYLKSPTPHGMPAVPVWYGNVGNAPLVSGASGSDIKTTSDIDWGESIYSATRDNYKLGSYIASVLLELLSRQRNPPKKIRSMDGTKTLDQDITKTGTDISLGPGEDVEAMEFIETTKDLAILWQAVQGEIQRGSIPYSAYGELSFAISGFAINSLNQSIGSFVTPRLDAALSAYDQIATLLTGQYVMGAYDVLSLSGYGQNKKYFNIAATPEQIAQGGDHRFYLEAQLPQDDLGRLQGASLFRQPGPDGRPLASDDWIRTEWLRMRNEEDIRDSILLQEAETATPKARMYSLLRGAINAGDMEMAKIYQFELYKMVQQEMMQLMLMGLAPPQPQQGSNGGTPASPPGFPPELLPLAQQGVGPPEGGAGLSNPGSQVPPGTPRPGAQRSVAERLAAAGLGGPRG